MCELLKTKLKQSYIRQLLRSIPVQSNINKKTLTFSGSS